MNRDRIREMTMQTVFQMDANNDFNYEHLNIIDEDIQILKSEKALSLLCNIRDNINLIDETIKRNLDKWTIDRIGKTELAILRTAVAEILFDENVPDSVAINEAVNLSKKYADEKSYAFVNAVLARIEKDR